MGTILQIKNMDLCQRQKQMFWILKLLGIEPSCLASIAGLGFWQLLPWLPFWNDSIPFISHPPLGARNNLRLYERTTKSNSYKLVWGQNYSLFFFLTAPCCIIMNVQAIWCWVFNRKLQRTHSFSKSLLEVARERESSRGREYALQCGGLSSILNSTWSSEDQKEWCPEHRA